MNYHRLKSLLPLLCAVLCAPLAHSQQFAFSNNTPIIIHDSAPPTPATPYPSAIQVNGFAGQVVTKATVTFHGLSHTFPSDIYILLVSPSGTRTILMADVGGQIGYSVTNLVITLDDDAANSLPVHARLTNGVFKPTNGDVVMGQPDIPFNFPPPAPPGTSNAPSALSVFNGTDPTGTWSLYVVDNVGGDAGSISGGWTLNLAIKAPLQIARSQNSIILSWPLSATNFTAQCVAIGSGNSWSNLAIPITQTDRFYVTSSLVPGSWLYRLKRD